MKSSLGQTATPKHCSRPRVNDRPYPKPRPSGQHPRRRFLRLAVGAAALPAVSCAPEAQSYPSRPITMIVPFPPGGNSDAVGRTLAERMRKSLGQPVIIENVSGADGSIGTGRAARATPDGYTIDLGMTTTHVMLGAVYSLSYDVLNDFTPISPVTMDWRILFAKKTMPAKDLKELIAWLKGNPNKASMGFTSVENHLVSALFQKQTGTQFALVPYRGFAPAMQDLLAGQIDLLFAAPDSLPLIRAGSIRAYAVTSDTRLVVAPDIPTFDEMGLPSLSYSAWMGLFAPRGTPRDIIAKLNAAAAGVLTDPEVRSRLADIGEEVFPRERQTPEVLGALVRADAEKWWPIIKGAGIKAE
jgi:tripartite-type tricarboxylate transporter receptor subunit TctC